MVVLLALLVVAVLFGLGFMVKVLWLLALAAVVSCGSSASQSPAANAAGTTGSHARGLPRGVDHHLQAVVRVIGPRHAGSVCL